MPVKQTHLRICLVEDDDHLRDHYIRLTESTAGFRCVGAYADAESALTDIPHKNPDVVLMDINLPGLSGITCTQKLTLHHPDLLVVMLTVFEDAENIFQSLAAGAVGYVIKSAKNTEIQDAIRHAAAGGSPMSAQIARKVVQSFRHPKPAEDELQDLTTREREILALLASGMQNKEIAHEIFVSTDTIKTHIRNIYRKLQVRTRTEAVLKYLDNT